MNCKCGNSIPDKRVEMGYKTCVDCSTEARWTVVPVNYHKTGNTAEVIKDPEVAADFIFQSQRKNFGVLRGMTSNRRRVETVSKPRKIQPPKAQVAATFIVNKYMPQYQFEEVGSETIQILETRGIDQAILHIENSLQTNRIFRKQADQLIEIVKHWK